jgi:hypothetical protein
VGQLVSEAAKSLGLPRIVGLTDFANASVEVIVNQNPYWQSWRSPRDGLM